MQSQSCTELYRGIVHKNLCVVLWAQQYEECKRKKIATVAYLKDVNYTAEWTPQYLITCGISNDYR